MSEVTMEQTMDTSGDTVSSAAPETTTPETTTATESGGGIPAGKETVEAAPVIPTYQPNFKFKVMDQEKEFDEWMRPHIKDADTEKKARELMEKAYGLDYAKPKHEATQKELENYKTSYGGLYKDVSETLQAKQIGDYETVFKKLGVTEKEVAKYLIDKANRANLPPEQKEVYDREERLRRENLDSNRQLQAMNQQFMAMASQARETQVDTILARTDINPTVQKYESINGKGSFKRFVAEFGVWHHSAYGQDPSAETAVSEIMKRLGPAYNGQQPVPQAAVGQQQLPVIPNVSGKSMSPVSKSPHNLKALRKMAKEYSE